MKKLFTMIRQGNFEEVQAIINKNPSLVNCVAGSTPKKDHGQSPLQVALKIGQIEIADYLIDCGADVNFMEAEDDDPGLRAPVLFDGITATIVSLCYGKFDVSDKALLILEKMIAKGADVNSFTSNGLGTINWAISNAEQIIQHPNLYIRSQDKAREKLVSVLDLLINNGADYIAWANRGYYPEPCPGPTSRSLFIDPILPENEFDISRIAILRDFLQEYFKSRNISF
ncbi:MAG: ankyrin repeat domain-containing protein [Lachnospiraceae bacterium]|nr:ankyrin repeat domain-containing protein [Lachnospiraceae bacterium]